MASSPPVDPQASSASADLEGSLLAPDKTADSPGTTHAPDKTADQLTAAVEFAGWSPERANIDVSGGTLVKPLPAPPRRVLLLKPCCLGDVVMATPLAAAIHDAWPEAEVDWAVDSHSAAGISNNPHVTAQLDATGAYRGAFELRAYVRLLRAVRRRHFDVAFVPDRSPLMAWLPRLAGIPHRIGLDSGGRGRAHTVRVPVPRACLETELYLDLARAVGVAATSARPVFKPTDDDRSVAAKLLGSLGPGGPLLALHPGGGVNPGMTLVEKRWPADRFGALAERAATKRNARVVVLGGPDDVDVADAVVAAAGSEAQAHVVSVAAGLSLPESAAVVEGCDIYVGNDSGMAHMAAAVGTPVVAIFGPTEPRRYGPVPGAGVAVAPDSGAVDRLDDARGSRLIEAVQVDDVWAAVVRLLDGPEGTSRK